MNNRFSWTVGILIVVGIAVGITTSASRYFAPKPYHIFPSLDSKYRVVVFRKPTLISAPGGSGDASGFVRLYDSSGKVLQEKAVDMVQVIDEVTWLTNKVEIKLFADWPLPK
jgi:hypothetical protein